MSYRIIHALLCAGALIFVGRADATMAVPGQFGVGASGAASYTIPIQTPPAQQTLRRN
jgi:hypothetical protein